MPEENLLVQNKSVHVKVFRAPTRKTFPKKFVFITVLAISTCLVIGGLIFWTNNFDQIGKEDETQRQTTSTTLKIPSVKQHILLNYFKRISNSKTISGIFVSRIGSSNDGVQDILRIAGVSPGIITTQMPLYTASETQWISFVEEVISNWKNRHLVHIRWFIALSAIKNFTDTSDKVDAERRWGELIKEGGSLNEVWKKELDKIVPHLHKLQSARVVPILDLLPNINSKYGIWRGRPGVNGTAKLYQITRDYLTKQHNLTSIIWNWSLYYQYMTHFEEFWPGSEYVDVASVVMWYEKELPMRDYERLINLVGDKPLSMDSLYTVPSLESLTAQPRWTWFTAVEYTLENTNLNNASNIQATLNSASVINKGDIDFFNDLN